MSEVKTNKITSLASNNDITLDPDGTGDVVVASGHNLGVGTTAPALPLEVNGSTNVAVFRSDASNSIIQLANSTGTGGDNGVCIGSVGDDLFLRAGDSERVRVDSNGHVGINDTNPSEAQLSVVTQQNESAAFLHCNASSMTGTTLAVSSSRNTTGGTYSHLECAIHGVAVKMKVLDGGDVKNTNNSYGAISDQRMKENIVDAASQWDDIKALQVRKYNRIGETQKELGVIAQELEASGMGGLVEEGKWYDVDNNSADETRKSVKYSVLYMKAVKALQEAMTRIETLETKVAALEAGE